MGPNGVPNMMVLSKLDFGAFIPTFTTFTILELPIFFGYVLENFYYQQGRPYIRSKDYAFLGPGMS